MSVSTLERSYLQLEADPEYPACPVHPSGLHSVHIDQGGRCSDCGAEWRQDGSLLVVPPSPNARLVVEVTGEQVDAFVALCKEIHVDVISALTIVTAAMVKGSTAERAAEILRDTADRVESGLLTQHVK